eukprot:TRINITY_DN34297_c0_g1_i1.p1 TRINITY_DN34297_c0_g1~~TRINITY_DN34297_c0_g1_i1.p1  ORF type:complete len:121 (-),score=11.08 TRINITY_DN34297_c0_g1_i1:150-512(-)
MNKQRKKRCGLQTALQGGARRRHASAIFCWNRYQEKATNGTPAGETAAGCKGDGQTTATTQSEPGAWCPRRQLMATDPLSHEPALSVLSKRWFQGGRLLVCGFVAAAASLLYSAIVFTVS